MFEDDADYLVTFDEAHSGDEDRFLAIGRVPTGVVTVAFAEPRDGVARIISARRATRAEAAALLAFLGGRFP